MTTLKIYLITVKNLLTFILPLSKLKALLSLPVRAAHGNAISLASSIILFLKLNYAIEVQSVQLLQLGADMNAVTYKANARSQSYFIKIKYGSYEETHIAILRLLHDTGLKEIIFPNSTVDGNLFKQFQHFKML